MGVGKVVKRPVYDAHGDAAAGGPDLPVVLVRPPDRGRGGRRRVRQRRRQAPAKPGVAAAAGTARWMTRPARAATRRRIVAAAHRGGGRHAPAAPARATTTRTSSSTAPGHSSASAASRPTTSRRSGNSSAASTPATTSSPRTAGSSWPRRRWRCSPRSRRCRGRPPRRRGRCCPSASPGWPSGSSPRSARRPSGRGGSCRWSRPGCCSTRSSSPGCRSGRRRCCSSPAWSLGESAYQAGWRRLAGLLWAIPFCKPHLALPLVPLAWYLGGWRRAVELVAVGRRAEPARRPRSVPARRCC